MASRRQANAELAQLRQPSEEFLGKEGQGLFQSPCSTLGRGTCTSSLSASPAIRTHRGQNAPLAMDEDMAVTSACTTEPNSPERFISVSSRLKLHHWFSSSFYSVNRQASALERMNALRKRKTPGKSNRFQYPRAIPLPRWPSQPLHPIPFVKCRTFRPHRRLSRRQTLTRHALWSRRRSTQQPTSSREHAQTNRQQPRRYQQH